MRWPWKKRHVHRWGNWIPIWGTGWHYRICLDCTCTQEQRVSRSTDSTKEIQ